VTSRLALLIPLALLACSPAPSSPAQAPGPPPGPAPAGPPSAEAGPAAPSAEPPSAKVTAIAPSKEDVPYVRAKILFSNPSRAACRVLGYKLLWAGQSKAITLQDLTLPPGETRERWLKVSPGDGNLAALTPESGRIELQTDCGR